MPEEENTSVTNVPEMPTPSEETAASTPAEEEQSAPVEAPADTTPDFSTLRIGDRKHFVLQDGMNEGACRPFDIANFTDKEAGLVNGFVTTDASRDYPGAGHDGLFIEACEFDAEHKPGTWHDLH